jgi:hypothetical protein
MLSKFSQNFSTNRQINKTKSKPKKVSLRKFIIHVDSKRFYSKKIFTNRRTR